MSKPINMVPSILGISQRIRRACEERGLSESQFAHHMGVSHYGLRKILTYKVGSMFYVGGGSNRSCDGDFLLNVARQIRVRLGYLVGLTDTILPAYEPIVGWVDMPTVAGRLQVACEKRGLTFRDLLDKTHVGYESMRRYYNGEAQAPMSTMVNLCRVLKVDIDWMYGLSIEMEAPR